ncbi:MAG: type II secretion system protein [bacterium]
MSNKGFTLIELIMVIVIVGILAVIAVPKIFSMTEDAKTSSREAVSANVLAGVTLYGVHEMATNGIEAYPTKLDNVTNETNCSKSNPCFSNALKDPVNDSLWRKINDLHYDYNPGPAVTHYEYNSIDGTFYIIP